MKLVIVLGIKESAASLNRALEQLEIPIYSEVDIKGFKTEDKVIDMTNWFGNKVDANFSVMFFAFVSNSVGETVLKKIDELNRHDGVRPFHAFLIDVEKFVRDKVN